MQGIHILADLSGCRGDAALLTDVARLRELCITSVKAAGLTAVGELFYAYSKEEGGACEQQSGSTGIVLLAESHLAVHTWPELASVTLDIYACNYSEDNSGKAEHLLNLLAEAFMPTDRSLQRGVQRIHRGAAAAFGGAS
jgi:S-adenosylmethionine/arginine decarboxylase-like enzyme